MKVAATVTRRRFNLLDPFKLFEEKTHAFDYCCDVALFVTAETADAGVPFGTFRSGYYRYRYQVPTYSYSYGTPGTSYRQRSQKCRQCLTIPL